MTVRAVAAFVLVPAFAGTGTARPPVSLVASPAHVALAGKARQTIRVTNSGRDAVVVDVTRAGFALDLRGRPRVVSSGSRSAVSWLGIRPRRLRLQPGGSASLAVSSAPPRRAEPGDHDALVLLTTRPRRGAGLAVRMRIGIVVAVRVPGTIVRRLDMLRLRARLPLRPRMLELWLANRGNVTEVVGPVCMIVTLRRGGRVLATLHPAVRQLLPRTNGIAEIPYRGRVHGWVRAQVASSARAGCGRTVRRTFRIRL